MRFFLRYFTSTKTFTEKISELEKKISHLEFQINLVKESVKETKETKKTESINSAEPPKEKENQPTIKIEHLQIEKIIIQKMDYANNFGQLGIRDLSGKLNIGTTYEGTISRHVEEKLEEKIEEKLGKTAKVHFRAQKET